MTVLCNTVPRATGRLLAIVVTAVVGLLQGCTTSTGGPTIGFRNETDTVMKATFWVGERDATRVGGAKMRRADEMNVGPNMGTRDSLTPVWEYRSSADTVVRIQIKPAGTSFNGPAEYWYEFASPSPYIMRARRGPGGEFVFSREGRGALTPVPEAFWVRPE
jgi:hypothetical protein